MQFVQNYSIMHLSYLFNDENNAFNFAVQKNMIYNILNCNDCGIQLKIYKDKYKKFSYYFKCTKCKRVYSILYQSIFYYSKILMNLTLYLIYCWAHKFSCFQTAHEVGVNKNTVSFYFKQFRSACFNYLMNLYQPKIGGINKIVEIDETLMYRRKYNRGRLLNDVWIFGGICREDGRGFAVVVENRKEETLWDQILQHIEKGTTIISDSWSAYSCIKKRGGNDYQHLTVNHSKNFIDPETGARTKRIERLWRELKEINQRYEGIPRDQVELHLDEFIWRQNEIGDTNDPFLKAIELISQTTFEPI